MACADMRGCVLCRCSGVNLGWLRSSTRTAACSMHEGMIVALLPTDSLTHCLTWPLSLITVATVPTSCSPGL